MTAIDPDAVPNNITDIAERVAAAVQSVDGLALLLPLRAHALRYAGSGAALAVTVKADLIEVRLVADSLPLPPLLDQAATATRSALAGTRWDHVPLRLVVAEISATALPG